MTNHHGRLSSDQSGKVGKVGKNRGSYVRVLTAFLTDLGPSRRRIGKESGKDRLGCTFGDRLPGSGLPDLTVLTVWPERETRRRKLDAHRC